jgi:hypothetical protein
LNRQTLTFYSQSTEFSIPGYKEQNAKKKYKIENFDVSCLVSAPISRISAVRSVLSMLKMRYHGTSSGVSGDSVIDGAVRPKHRRSPVAM